MNPFRFRNSIQLIQSKELQTIAKHLQAQNIPITSYGKTWSKATAAWIYFDTVLDLVQLRTDFDLGEHITVHQNLDPKSGTESGFIDEKTGEGLMGKLSQG